jgi:beta-N-acetylhexosaminidase
MDSAWTDRAGPVRVGTGRVGTGRVGTGRVGTGQVGTGQGRTGQGRADRVTRGRHGSAGRIRSAAQPAGGRRPGPADSGATIVRKRWVRFGGLAVAAIVAAAFATNALAGRTGQHHAQPPAGAAGVRSGQGAAAGRAGVGHGGASHSGASHNSASHNSASGSQSRPAAAAPAGGASGGAAALPKLGDRQLAGQRVIYSYSGLTPPSSLLYRIRHGQAAGVIFFGQNISSPAQIKSVIQQLIRADAAKTNPVRAPLLLMTDQEGGEVRRLPGQPYLSEKQIGESAHPQAAATAAGQGAGLNLLSVGMNVNLAPVLDVYRHAGDFDDQFQRSYSKNPKVVSKLGTDFILAQQRTGVAATVKHFPGLGAASRNQDTDVRPVTLKLSVRTIRNIDEYPYRSAIRTGHVKLVMVSWAIYPSLDKTFPAGLSSKIVQGELRQRLQFRGVTITDALEAGALSAFGSYSHRALLAASAGMDLILASGQNVTEGNQAASGLETGYRNGTLGHAAFQASVARILALRASLPS